MRPLWAALATALIIMLPRVHLPEVNRCSWAPMASASYSCQTEEGT